MVLTAAKARTGHFMDEDREMEASAHANRQAAYREDTIRTGELAGRKGNG
jgi:hypothetical protein